MDTEWEELERMATAAGAADAQIADESPKPDAIARWQKLFNYNPMEASSIITAQRADLTRPRITDEHWDLVRAEKEAVGYDREAYEHSLQLGDILKKQSATIPMKGADGEVMFMFRLGGLLDSVEKVKEVAGLEEVPVEKEAWGEMGPAKFCFVSKNAQGKIEEWLQQQRVEEKR
ncbi:hypothetical protein BDV96DRAFT_594043 [Lophiotrema nucula]|uniref:Uncharacterized protein n=1 Tax=Lophiotrema nucula TaxID=690887 RepID=A0A6A5ZTF5_9PLEO|nr:hypothetical protein BDV96DRAFT_594043 [Lophiotrema nucula]